MLPIPKIGNEIFPEPKKYIDTGSHTKLYRYSPDDYREMDQIWEGPALDGGTAEVVDTPPDTASPHVDLARPRSAFAPDYHPEEVFEMV